MHYQATQRPDAYHFYHHSQVQWMQEGQREK